MTSGDLDVSRRDTGVEGGHDERGPEHVRMHGTETGTLPDRPNPAVGGATVEALTVTAPQDGSLVALTNGQGSSSLPTRQRSWLILPVSGRAANLQHSAGGSYLARPSGARQSARMRLVTGPDLPLPELRPGDERTALVQRLDLYRAIAAAALVDLEWEAASTRLLPATDLTIAGIVKHLAWVEDRWFQGRLLGVQMPAPWDAPGADDPDQAMRLASDDTVAGIVQLYSRACSRSRSALARCDSLDHVAAVPSFGIGPVNLRWILIHMIDETARHAGHLDLLRDCLRSG